MPFDFEASLARAERRFGERSSRAPRADRGVARLDPRVEALVGPRLLGYERPDFKALHAELVRQCRAIGVRPPARSSLYGIAERYHGHSYPIATLPSWVAELLHNVDPAHAIVGKHLVFACLNYGDTRAMSYAAGLPWLDLHQARKLRGYRLKSRGVLDAICQARDI
jgi:hypothetical protein